MSNIKKKLITVTDFTDCIKQNLNLMWKFNSNPFAYAFYLAVNHPLHSDLTSHEAKPNHNWVSACYCCLENLEY